MSTQGVYHAAETVVIDAGRAGQRLDNYLFAQFRQLPKGRVYKMLRKGEVRVNGGRVRQNYRLSLGDQVRLPPVHLPPRQQSGNASDAMVARVLDAIIHEDEDLIVIDKPSGMAVHAGSDVAHGVIELLRQARPNDTTLELVHRLDRATSGCLLLARNRPTLQALHAALRANRIHKGYLALLAGRWRGGERRLEHRLSSRGGQARKTRLDPAGKLAVSTFRPVARFEDATLMEIDIETGRTHQIRVQSAAVGHPVLGDDKYGDFELNRRWRKRGLKRLFLHAASLRIEAGSHLGERRFRAELPAPLAELTASLAPLEPTP